MPMSEDRPYTTSRAILEAIAGGKLKLPIGLKLPLAQAAEAHRLMEARQTTGKILLEVD